MTRSPVDPDLLNGWKEIASWSGKSVRSVQRWERDLGLPVHRIKTPDGQSVYARRSELDGWRASLDIRRTRALDGDAAHEDTPEPAPGDEAARDARPWWGSMRARAIFVIPGVLLIGAAVWPFVQGVAGGPPVVTAYQYVDTRLQAVDATGRTVWAHDFGYPVMTAGVFEPSRVDPVSADLDGDGRSEVIVGVKHGKAYGSTRNADALYCFEDTGDPCWVVQPDMTLACGDGVYGPPWQLSAVAVVSREEGKRVWAAFNHHTWWPSFVMEIRPDGTAALIYLQSGWVASLAEWTVGTHRYLVAGGVLNERQEASVVFVPVDRLPARSPDDEERYACTVELAGRPEAILGFPAFDLHTVSAPYPFAYYLQPMAGALKVGYGDGTASVVAELDEGLEVTSLAPADGYWFRHEQLSSAGVVDHAADDCPEHDAVKTLDRWSVVAGWMSTSWSMRR